MEENIEEEYEEKDVEVFEFSLTEDEISEFIEKLNNLRETKGEISFQVDEGNELLISYEEEIEEEYDEEEETDEKESESNQDGEY